MKTSRRWTVGSLAGKLVMGFVMVLMIGSINVAPALSKDHHRNMENYDQKRYERDRDRQERVRYERERRRGYEHERYERRRRGYDPPPVIFVPPPPPGIRIFFPPIFINP
jgi:hypothetical protein